MGIKVIANDMTDGKGLVIESKKLSKGTGIELINNEELTSGKLLNLQTSSRLAHNPVAIDASSMTNGEVMKIEGDALTSGAALVLTTNDGSKMMSSMSSQNIEMIVDNVGKLLVTKAVFGEVNLYDKINLENCDGYKKNTADEFMITVKTSNVTKKHSCSIPCADSTVSATTTSPATTAAATTTEAGTTSSTTTDAPSTTTTTTGAATTTTSSAIVNVYTCARLLDCPASNRTLSYVVGDDCTNSNDTFCEYDTHGFIELSYVDTSTYSVGSDIFNATNTPFSSAGNCQMSRLGGKVLNINAEYQKGGTLIDISANSLEHGTGIHVKSNALSSGSLVKLTSKSTSPTNGILRMQSNDATNGKLISIEANGLNDGTAIDIKNDGTDLSTGSLIKLLSKSRSPTNGILRIQSNDATNGKLISIEADGLTDGTAIDINNDGTELSTGSLIKVTSKASGTDAGNNGLIKVIANDMSDGKGLVIKTQKLSKGT